MSKTVLRYLSAFIKDKDQGQGQCNGNDLEDWHYQAGRHLAVMFAFCMERRVFLGYHFTPADGRKDVLAVVYRFRDQMPRVIV